MTTFSSNVFGNADLGDQITPLSSAGFALWVGFIAMFFGGLAFALAPLLGRAGAAGVAGLAMAALWLANGMNVGGPLLLLSPFSWTFDHVPLVAVYDWPSLVLVGTLGVVLLAAGVELFSRRDLGVTAGLSLPSLPAAVLGVHGPTSRAFGDQLPRALSWGTGLFLIGILYTALAGSLADTIKASSGILDAFAGIFPDADFASVGGWMQFYAELLFIAAGFAGATFVSRWASDEGDGRLEMALTTPMARARWVVAGGVAALLAVVVTTVLFAAGVGIGSAIGGLSSGEALVGCASLGIYAAAIVGIGFAVGGLWRTSIAAEIAALVVVATYLLDLVAPPLNLPDWLHQLALTAHFGKPMVGEWDMVGVAACLVIAVGGILLGAWGMRRRDVD
jgi:ABC-2 type transport system permease protein